MLLVAAMVVRRTVSLFSCTVPVDTRGGDSTGVQKARRGCWGDDKRNRKAPHKRLGLASRNHHRIVPHLIFPVNGTSARAPRINIEERTIEARLSALSIRTHNVGRH